MAENLLLNPSFETAAADPLKAASWTYGSSVAGTATYSRPAGRFGLCSQRVEYTGVAGDAATYLRPEQYSAVGSFAPGDPATLSAWAKGALTGCNFQLALLAYTAAGAYIAQTAVDLTASLTADWSRLSATYPVLPANTSKIRAQLMVYNIHEGDTVDIYFDGVKLEKSSTPTSFAPTAARLIAARGT